MACVESSRVSLSIVATPFGLFWLRTASHYLRLPRFRVDNHREMKQRGEDHCKAMNPSSLLSSGRRGRCPTILKSPEQS
ncbi:hypothetical protein ACFX12_018910 [Malus domestica]